MNPAAKVTGMKGLSVDRVKEIKTKRDFENVLRESGVFSKDACVMLASKFREPDQSESDEENGNGEEIEAVKIAVGDLNSKLEDFINSRRK